MLLLTLFAGCDPSADVATVAPTGLEGSWVATLTAHPEQFEAHVANARPGWIALHKNGWLEAAAAGGVPGQRAQAELVVFYGVLADTSREAWHTLGDTWEKRGTLPTDSALPAVVAQAAREAGDEAYAAHWDSLPTRADPAVNARAEQHDALRKGTGDLAAMRALAAAPLVQEPLAVGTRALYDPRVYTSLLEGTRHAASGGPTDPLEQVLFSSRLSVADTSAAASVTRLGLTLPTTDDTEACREVVRGLDRLLDPWKIQLAGAAPPDGQALLTDLRLVDGLRARMLVDLGVAALGTQQPRCALAYADLALDHENARALTPINSPTLFAVLAAANLRTGHTREALDALEVLVTPFPEVVGLDETVSDLAVLQGLDRTGDSREN